MMATAKPGLHGCDKMTEEKKDDDLNERNGELNSQEDENMDKNALHENSTLEMNGDNDIADTCLESSSSTPAPYDDENKASIKPISRSSTFATKICGSVLRICLLDFPLALLFALYVSTLCVEWIGKQYLLPQIQLMRFQKLKRNTIDQTYYHRFCTEKDLTATKTEELVLSRNATTKEAVEHMLYHGVSIYQDLLSEETTSTLRAFILEQNQIQEGWYVIENTNRYSWGIDINMHPTLQNLFQDLVSNKQFVQAIQAIVGPDPAIIEFSAITSTYGATDQMDHPDVASTGSGAKYARSYVPSYTLFLPLQDTTSDMGATHVCPGSHLCSENCEKYCFDHSLPVSGYNGSIWPRGSGALMNQQLTHKGMAHKDPNAPDRAVLTVTFAPRPQTYRDIETRQIGQAGTFSLKWTHWGHTLYDYVHANRRMTEPQIRLRSLGLLKGKGFSWISVASMRISNADYGYCPESFDEFIEEGALPYWPKRWQAIPQIADDEEEGDEDKEEGDEDKEDGEEDKKEGDEDEEESAKVKEEELWETFVRGTITLSKEAIGKMNILALCFYVALVSIFSTVFGSRKDRKMQAVLNSIKRLVFTYISIVTIAIIALRSLTQTSWAKQITNGKAYQLPETPEVIDNKHFGTLPVEDDILITIHYASERLASYSEVLDAAHPGNRNWRALIKYSAPGYENLPANLQVEMSKTLMEWGNQAGRFLRHNSIRQWSEITDTLDLLGIAHEELMKASHPTTAVLLKQLDSLEADLIYGRWHDMVIHKQHMPAYISRWRSKLSPPLKLGPHPLMHSFSQSLPPPRKSANDLSHTPIPLRQRSRILQRRSRQQPFSGAWATERDLVEVQDGNEWYQAIVVEVHCASMMVSIDYLDGEEDYVHRSCLRDFIPYSIGEKLQIIKRNESDDGTWIGGTVVESAGNATGNDAYKVDGEDGVSYDVAPLHIRRKNGVNVRKNFRCIGERAKDAAMKTAFSIGASVYVLSEEDGGWFSAVISGINDDDGTFSVSFTDGDKGHRVSRRHLQPREMKRNKTSA